MDCFVKATWIDKLSATEYYLLFIYIQFSAVTKQHAKIIVIHKNYLKKIKIKLNGQLSQMW